MKRHCWLLVLCALTLMSGTADAGLFNKKSKPDPKQRVPELLVTIKTDKDEHKRSAAATELRQYDAAAFPDIVPVLVDVLLSDAKTSVRAEAAESLSKIRPVSKQAGLALEQALEKDSSMRVRMQARYALLQYHWAGYKSGGKEPVVAETKEPPLAPPESKKPIASATKGKQQKVLKPVPETQPPPIAPDETPSGSEPQASSKKPATPPAKSSASKPKADPPSSDGPTLDPDG